MNASSVSQQSACTDLTWARSLATDFMALHVPHSHQLLRLTLLVSALVLCCRTAESAQVPGIVSQADLDAQYAALPTAGGSRQDCQVRAPQRTLPGFASEIGAV